MRKLGLLVATGAATLAFTSSASAISVVLPPLVQANINTFAAPVCAQQGGLFYVGGQNGNVTYTCREPMRIGDLLKGAAVCNIIFGGTFSVLPKPPGLPLALIPSNGGYACSFYVQLPNL